MINKLALCRDFMGASPLNKHIFHVFICQLWVVNEFSFLIVLERGMCPRGEKCPYRHVTETTEFNLPSQNIQPLNIITPSNYQANCNFLLFIILLLFVLTVFLLFLLFFISFFFNLSHILSLSLSLVIMKSLSMRLLTFQK
jgi:hypothetical protein